MRIVAVAGVLGAILAGAAMLTWGFGLFAASFSPFGDTNTVRPEPVHLLLMHVVAPALLGLATVPITFVQGAGWGRVGAISLTACATGTVASIWVLDGAKFEGGAGTFVTVAVAVPAVAVLAAWVGGRDRDDVAAVAGGLALSVVVLALLCYACSGFSLLLTLLFGLSAWVVFPMIVGTIWLRAGHRGDELAEDEGRGDSSDARRADRFEQEERTSEEA